MKIAIIEDEKESLDNLLVQLDRYQKENNVEISHVDFTSGEAFLAKYDHSFDVVFMDILLDGMTGLKTSEKLREIDGDVYLIFITNMAQYAIEGYKYSAQDYFVKPVRYESLKMRLDRIKDTPAKADTFFINVPQVGGVVKIYAKDLLYIESVAHDMLFHTKKEVIKARYKTLKDFEEMLQPFSFVKCNMCYLVNLRYCTSVQGTDLHIGNDVIQISRAKRSAFLHDLSDYLSKGGRK